MEMSAQSADVRKHWLLKIQSGSCRWLGGVGGVQQAAGGASAAQHASVAVTRHSGRQEMKFFNFHVQISKST
jgi:hypothetical protein